MSKSWAAASAADLHEIEVQGLDSQAVYERPQLTVNF